MSEEGCTLCGQPVLLGAYAKEGELLRHGGELTQIVGWDHVGECRPIMSSCYRAWVEYGYRPEAEHDCC